MTFERLTLTSPGSRSYTPGTPIEVFDGGTHLGTVRTVELSATGHELRLGDFAVTDATVIYTRNTALLLIAEVVTFAAERYSTVNAIEIHLDADIDGFEGCEAYLAAVRSEMLQRIGSHSIQVQPKPHPGRRAHFTVTGIWSYDRESLAALDQVLKAERAAYAQHRTETRPMGLVESMLSRVFAARRKS
jgi:hypothetical protein